MTTRTRFFLGHFWPFSSHLRVEPPESLLSHFSVSFVALGFLAFQALSRPEDGRAFQISISVRRFSNSMCFLEGFFEDACKGFHQRQGS